MPGYTRAVTTADRSTERALDAAQTDGLLDMDVESFRKAAHDVVDLMADYLASVETFAVFPNVEPGSIGPSFPSAAPERPEPIAAILDDYRRLIEPNATHWQHPGFLAYFGTTASGPGILGEMLTASLGQNAMLWRTSPIATELEGVVVGWLRQAVGLPVSFDGLITDTASTSSLIALAGARELAGGAMGRMRSIEKACMTLGLGRGALVHVPVNERFEMDIDELSGAIARDRSAGLHPIAIVATVGTTSSTSADPVAAAAEIAERERLWLHVDAAYAGAVAIVPELRAPFGHFFGFSRFPTPTAVY